MGIGLAQRMLRPSELIAEIAERTVKIFKVSVGTADDFRGDGTSVRVDIGAPDCAAESDQLSPYVKLTGAVALVITSHWAFRLLNTLTRRRDGHLTSLPFV